MIDYAVESFDHVGITVSDMDRAMRFFGDVLGARTMPARYYDDPIIGRVSGMTDAKLSIGHAFLGGYSFELLHYHYPDDRRRPTLRPCDDGHIHLALNVRGIDALAARMDEEGFRAAGPIQRGVGAKGIAAIYMCGFDNLIVELLDAGAASA